MNPTNQYPLTFGGSFPSGYFPYPMQVYPYMNGHHNINQQQRQQLPQQMTMANYAYPYSPSTQVPQLFPIYPNFVQQAPQQQPRIPVLPLSRNLPQFIPSSAENHSANSSFETVPDTATKVQNVLIEQLHQLQQQGQQQGHVPPSLPEKFVTCKDLEATSNGETTSSDIPVSDVASSLSSPFTSFDSSPNEVLSPETLSPIKKEPNYTDKDFLRILFKRFSTQDLLLCFPVCKIWYQSARENLKLVNHLKLTSPTVGAILPCMHLPYRKPCSQQKFICATLKPYFFVSNCQEDKRSNTKTYEKQASGQSYSKQIDAIVDKLEENCITSLDIFDCPRQAHSLTYLLNVYKDSLECLSLDRVPCMAVSFPQEQIWDVINAMPKLRKLAISDILSFPSTLPILNNLEEFHVARSKTVVAGLHRNQDQPMLPTFYLIRLLTQLTPKLKKLSLNLLVQMKLLVEFKRHAPQVVENITHLELLVGPDDLFHCKFIGLNFTSITHLLLLLDDSEDLYLHVFEYLPQFRQLRHLGLTETAKCPSNSLVSVLHQNSNKLTVSQSVRSLHLEVSLNDYTELASGISTVFPEVEEIVFKNLSIDSNCICYSVGADDETPKPPSPLTKCDACCVELKELLFAKFAKLCKVYGVEVDSYFEEKYGVERWNHCRYAWL